VEFEKSLALNPDNSFALSNLGHIHLIQNDLLKAQDLIEKARKANPRDWFACGLQGDISTRLEDLAGAESAYEEQTILNRSLKHQPNNRYLLLMAKKLKNAT